MNCQISIIIPVYRAEQHIARCCESLFVMDCKEVEYLFINDASPDRSMEIVKNVLSRFPARSSQVRIINQEENKGVACARNTGLNEALGKYVAFVDADDFIEPDMFSKMYQTAENYQTDIVGCDWYLEFEHSRRQLKQSLCHHPQECLKAMLAGEMRWFLWAFLIRRELYTANQLYFIDGADIGEDMFMLIRCFSYARSYKHIEEPLYHYVRYNSESLTCITPKKQMDMVKQNVDAVADFLNGRFPDIFRKDLCMMKLNVKFPLLITDETACYKVWKECFPEANSFIWENKKQAFRNKVLQWCAMKNYYWILKAYYKFVFKFIYGIIYR